jgi:undecaprenyl-diphosphatase
MAVGPAGRTDWTLLAGGLLALLTFAGVTTLVHRNGFDDTDGRVRTLAGTLHRTSLQPFMEGASLLGGSPGQAALVVAGAALLWRRRRRWAVGLPIVMAGAAVLQLAAKWASDRPRPNLAALGYPSGHTLSLVVLLGYLVYVLATSGRPTPWRVVAGGLAGLGVGVVAASRVYLDAHWLSDIVGGLAAGLAYLLLALAVIRFTASSRAPLPP